MEQQPKINVLYAWDKSEPDRWLLAQEITLPLTTGDKITIPAGYRTDFASVPRWLWSIVSPIGLHNRACLLHDWLYDNQYSITNKADQYLDRLFADRQMRHYMKLDGVSWLQRQVMYYAVRLGGKSWFLD